MCIDYPGNIKTDEILLKTLIIGRVYSATLERDQSHTGKKPREGKDFYLTQVVPRFKIFFRQKDIIHLVENIKNKNTINDEIVLHGKFVKAIGPERGTKISFASKYLHFHFKNNFFIYDSRAIKALPYLETFMGLEKIKELKKLNTITIAPKDIDHINADYYNFASRCYILQLGIKELKGSCTNRQLDNILLDIANIIMLYEIQEPTKKVNKKAKIQ
ncbi:MAG: hypothetical protein ABI863_12870 [Ginsengibacter sp.]